MIILPVTLSTITTITIRTTMGTTASMTSMKATTTTTMTPPLETKVEGSKVVSIEPWPKDECNKRE